MTIYVARIKAYDVRLYLPNDSGFNLQEYIDWILSFEGVGSYWPTAAEQDTDGNLVIEYYDAAGGGNSDVIVDGEHLISQTIPEEINACPVKITSEYLNRLYAVK